MAKRSNPVLICLVLLSLGFFLFACTNILPHPPTPTAINSGVATRPPNFAQLESIDSVLQNAVLGRIAYNAPNSMQLEQAVQIQLLLDPSAGPDELKQLIVEAGQVTEAEVMVTPFMKAELIPDDPQAFVIQSFHDSAGQVVLADSPTEWRWSVVAKKSGDQVLTLTLKRQVQVNSEITWRLVQTYKNTIHISVSAGQQLRQFDWKWLLGILLTALIIPAIWRYVDQRKKKKE